MKKLTYLVFLPFYLFTFLPLSAQQYESFAGDAMQTRIYTLDNGLKVYLSVNKEKPRIQTYIAVRTGSKNDPAETTGLAHYLEHLMFKGTDKFGTNNAAAEKPLLDEIQARYEEYRLITDPALRKQKYHEIDSISQIAAQYFIPNEYDKLMATIGAQGTNAYTSNDVTCYTEDIPSNEIENWAKIQADRFQNMVIRGFHTELEAVYEEYNIGIAKDSRKLFATICKMLWPNHPYGLQTTIGTQEHLKNPSIVNIKNYFNHWYVPNNVAICMSGDFEPDQVIAIIDKYFGSWKPGADVAQPTFAPLPPLTQPKDTTIIGQEAETIWMGWRAKQANEAQADTLQLMEDVLSNGRAGLFDLDLNQTMKVQSAYGGAELLHDHGAFFLMGRPKEGQTLDEVKGTWPEGNVAVRCGDYMFRPHQIWNIAPVPEAGGYLSAPYFKITIDGTDRALTATADRELTTAPFNGGDEQLWRIEQLTDGTYRIMPKAIPGLPGINTRYCLYSAADSTPTLAEYDFKSDNSKWNFKLVQQ